MIVDSSVLSQMVTNTGVKLSTLSNEKAVLLVFLRHFGCTFCREAMDDLSKIRHELEEDGVQIVLVHMSDDETADIYLHRFNLDGIPYVTDPECFFYEKFGLVKGNFKQLFGLSVWMRGIDIMLREGYGIGRFIGDGFQMPGVFLLQHGGVVNSFIHQLASDRPDYEELVSCCRTSSFRSDDLTNLNLSTS